MNNTTSSSIGKRAKLRAIDFVFLLIVLSCIIVLVILWMRNAKLSDNVVNLDSRTDVLLESLGLTEKNGILAIQGANSSFDLGAYIDRYFINQPNDETLVEDNQALKLDIAELQAALKTASPPAPVPVAAQPVIVDNDSTVGNEILKVMSGGGLVRVGDGSALNPYAVGLRDCGPNQVLKSSSISGWDCAGDLAGQYYEADGQGLVLAGTTFGLSLDGASLTKNASGLTLNLSSPNTWLALQSFGSGLEVAPGQALTLNGESFTDLTGSGLVLSGGELQTIFGTSIDLSSSEVVNALGIAKGGTSLSTIGTANQLLGVNGAGTALEYKNIGSLLIAGSGISLSGTSEITITADSTGTCSTAGQFVCSGGNAIGGTLVMGSTDAQDLSLITSGLSRITVDSTGDVTIGSSANSATAVQFQDNNSNNVLVVDTSNNAVKIGGGDVGVDGTSALLVLDTKNTSGDPAGVDGGMY